MGDLESRLNVAVMREAPDGDLIAEREAMRQVIQAVFEGPRS